MPDFAILAVFEHLWLFLEIKEKKAYFQSEKLGSGKTLSKLHIHYKSLCNEGILPCRMHRILQKFYGCPKNHRRY